MPTAAFTDFPDDLDALFSATTPGNGEPVEFSIPAPTHEVKCEKCAGRGKFVSYSGRVVGPCFTCKGSGVIVRKTAPEKLAANRAKARERKERAQAQAWDAFKQAHPLVAAWIENSRGSFEFAASLYLSVEKFGDLTERQLAAAEKCAAKKVEAMQAAQARVENAPAIDIQRIEQAFAAAVGNGIKRPKLRLAAYKFSPAPAHGRNAGAIYATEGETYLGKIQGGKFVASRDCTPEKQAEILQACADPEKAATAYGMRTGVCSCCGRELTKGESIDRGIGPICAEKYGW